MLGYAGAIVAAEISAGFRYLNISPLIALISLVVFDAVLFAFVIVPEIPKIVLDLVGMLGPIVITTLSAGVMSFMGEEEQD